MQLFYTTRKVKRDAQFISVMVNLNKLKFESSNFDVSKLPRSDFRAHSVYIFVYVFVQDVLDVGLCTFLKEKNHNLHLSCLDVHK